MFTVFLNIGMFSCSPETNMENESLQLIEEEEECCGDDTPIIPPPPPSGG